MGWCFWGGGGLGVFGGGVLVLGGFGLVFFLAEVKEIHPKVFLREKFYSGKKVALEKAILNWLFQDHKRIKRHRKKSVKKRMVLESHGGIYVSVHPFSIFLILRRKQGHSSVHVIGCIGETSKRCSRKKAQRSVEGFNICCAKQNVITY